MKKILAILVMLSLTACASLDSVVTLIPSFNDSNQSSKIIDIRADIERIDCTQPQLPQAQLIQRDLQWFHLYSESAGIRNSDVIRIIAPMEESVTDWANRSAKEKPSEVYCNIKKNILKDQAKSAAKAVLGRF